MSSSDSSTREISERDLEPLENSIQLYKNKVAAGLPTPLRLKIERLLDALGQFARHEVHRGILDEYGAPHSITGDS